MNYLKLIIVCLTLCFCAGSVSLAFVVGISDYNKRIELQKKRKIRQQFEYNNPDQPDSQVNDPGRYWFA
jgi:hypothetical protein